MCNPSLDGISGCSNQTLRSCLATVDHYLARFYHHGSVASCRQLQLRGISPAIGSTLEQQRWPRGMVSRTTNFKHWGIGRARLTCHTSTHQQAPWRGFQSSSDQLQNGNYWVLHVSPGIGWQPALRLVAAATVRAWMVCFVFMLFYFLGAWMWCLGGLGESWSAFFNSQFWNENGQNVKCAHFFIPYSHSGMDRTPFQPFCSQEQNERNVANENQRWLTAGRVLSIQTRPYRTYRRKNLDILLGKMTIYFLSHYTKSTRRISVMFPYLLRNVYSCQDRASRRAFFYAGNPNYSEHSVPTILIPE